MSRFSTMGLFVLMLLGIQQLSADEQPKQAGLYYPTEFGTEWMSQYVGTNHDRVKTKVQQVTKTKEGIVVETALILGDDPKTFPVKRVLASDKGLFVLSSGTTKFVSPICILKLPSKPGDTWDTVSKSAEGVAVLTCVRRDDEVLDLPFKKNLKTIRIDTTQTSEVGTVKSSVWYHEKYGQVKCECNKQIIIIDSFTPPTKK